MELRGSKSDEEEKNAKKNEQEVLLHVLFIVGLNRSVQLTNN